MKEKKIKLIVNVDNITESHIEPFAGAASRLSSETRFKRLNPKNIDFSGIQFIGEKDWGGADAIITRRGYEASEGYNDVIASTGYFRQVIWLMTAIAKVIRPDYLDKLFYYPFVAKLTNDFIAANPEPEEDNNPEYTAKLLSFIYDHIAETLRWEKA